MSVTTSRPGALSSPAARIAAAASVTILDGFDVFSLSLMIPAISRELDISTASLGPVFASSMAGMIAGAVVGGTLADRFGRLRILLAAFALFAAAALTMPLVGDVRDIVINRFTAGIGLGAAAPIAVALLNRTGERPPSEFVIALIWAGIGLGGMLAALFNYLVASDLGWQSIFIVGGLLPIPVALFVWFVFRGTDRHIAATSGAAPPRFSGLFADGQAPRTLLVAGMFFTGFITTAIIVYWTPTILNQRDSSPAVISATFAGINGGAVVGPLLFGWLGSRGRAGRVRTLAWTGAALSGIVAAFGTTSTTAIAVLAIIGTIMGAGAQALSYALANELHRARGLQTTSMGFMSGTARLGQFSALSVSGAVVAFTAQGTTVFALAGVTAAVAAALSLVAIRWTKDSIALK